MYTLGVLLLFVTSQAESTLYYGRPLEQNGYPGFLYEPTQYVNENIQQQNRLTNLFATGYVNQYVENIQKPIYNEVHGYVNAIQNTVKKIDGALSFVPEYTVVDEELLEHPDVELSVPARIARNGYDCETHTVTSRGYILNIHRIPRSKNGSTTPMKTVILHHGILCSSADWILNGPEKALAYVLAEAGYDVWMPNIRGNRYSKEHSSLKTDSKAFWNFSWHDVAEHDVPAIIDYIKRVKGSDAPVAYIGHSMGTSILFAMLSLRPEYNDKLVAGVALAPVAFMSNVTSSIRSLTLITSNVAHMEMLYGSHEFMPKAALGDIAGLCESDLIDLHLCKNFVFSICGYNEAQFNKTLLPVLLKHIGTGTSWKTFVHYAQEIESGGRFQMFDYGSYYNNRLYHSETPPEYDLSKVRVPIKLFWAQNDLLSNEVDVRTLYDKLPYGTEVYKIPDPNFNHLDYLWAIDAPRLLNNKLLETLERAFYDRTANRFDSSLE